MFRCWRGRALCVLDPGCPDLRERRCAGAGIGGGQRPDTIEELVVANHVLAKLKVLDAFGHVTIRHPANPQRYLMARSIAPAMVTIGDIVEFDLEFDAIRCPRPRAVDRTVHPS